MPEVAEVALMSEAIRKIAPYGVKITKIVVLGGRYAQIGLNSGDNFCHMCPLKIDSIKTKGKRLFLEIEKGWFILISFGMSGSIQYEPTDADLERAGVAREEYMRHFHIRFELDNGTVFYFSDPRRFGTVWLFNNRPSLDRVLDKLGPDILSSQIDDKIFIERLRRYDHQNICRVLMAQEAVSGVGNYIVNEALYQTRISPFARVADIPDASLIELNKTLHDISRKAYEEQGASLYTYTGAKREKGRFQDMLKIYRKSYDPEGRPVVVIPDREAPDRRTKHYVPEVQTIGTVTDRTIGSEPKKIPRPTAKFIHNQLAVQ